MTPTRYLLVPLSNELIRLSEEATPPPWNLMTLIGVSGWPARERRANTALALLAVNTLREALANPIPEGVWEALAAALVPVLALGLTVKEAQSGLSFQEKVADVCLSLLSKEPSDG